MSDGWDSDVFLWKKKINKKTTYPVCAEVYALDAVPELLMKHRLVVVTASTWQKGPIDKGGLGMRWSPREVGASGVCQGAFNASTSHYWAGSTLHQDQCRNTCFDAISPCQPCLEQTEMLSCTRKRCEMGVAYLYRFRRQWQVLYLYLIPDLCVTRVSNVVIHRNLEYLLLHIYFWKP